MVNEEHLESWIHDYYDRLTYVAFTYVRNRTRAEDIVQESFVKAIRSIHQLKDHRRSYPWLLRIVINESHTSITKSRREQPTEFLPEQNTTSTEDIYLQRSQSQEVYSAITSLAEKLRTPIILYYFEDLSIREIADVLNLGEGAVKTRLNRGRDRLKKILKRGDLNELGNTYSAGETKLYPH